MIQLFEYHKINKRQADVDFLIPFLDIDRRYCLDPALLRFSKTPLLKIWNREIEDFLKLIHHVMKGGNTQKLANLINFPELTHGVLADCKLLLSSILLSLLLDIPFDSLFVKSHCRYEVSV